MNIIKRIEKEFTPRNCSSDQFMYDYMESQSNQLLPIIYQPFDITKRSHWSDRGYILDYACSAGSGTILDYGPGDGWPSLPVASFARHIIGVDSSLKRIETCRENARRLQISNVEFVHVPAGQDLPFDNATFNGVMAASSIEQSPDPFTSLRELYRVLKPGGTLRMYYESLESYRGEKEKEPVVWETSRGSLRLDIYDRHIDDELAVLYGNEFKLKLPALKKLLDVTENACLDLELVENKFDLIKPYINVVLRCRLSQPSALTWSLWLKDVGFRKIKHTRSGGDYLYWIYAIINSGDRPDNLAAFDSRFKRSVQEIIEDEISPASNTMITAVK